MGNYTGYRILAKLRPGKFRKRHRQWLNWDSDPTDRLGRLIQRAASGSHYFEFEVDNYGNPLKEETLSSQAPFRPGNRIDAFFSAKEHQSHGIAASLCGELAIPKNTIVPFMMAQYEENRCPEYGCRATVYFAVIGKDNEPCVLWNDFRLDIQETAFDSDVIGYELIRLSKRLKETREQNEKDIVLNYRKYLKAFSNSRHMALRGKYVHRHKNKRLRRHLKG